MKIFEFKIKAKPFQYTTIDDAIRAAQLVQNKCLRYLQWLMFVDVGQPSIESAIRSSTSSKKRQGTAGHVGTPALDVENASRELTATEVGENLSQQVAS